VYANGVYTLSSTLYGGVRVCDVGVRVCVGIGGKPPSSE